MELDCTGKTYKDEKVERDGIEATLSLETGMISDPEKLLLGGGKISLITVVELREKGSDKELWPIFSGTGKEMIDIQAEPKKKQLKATIYHMNEKRVETGHGTMMSREIQKEITCDVTDYLKEEGTGKTIYQGIMSQSRLGVWKSTDSQHLKFDLSLRRCSFEKVGEASCTLKVVVFRSQLTHRNYFLVANRNFL